jgi:hypothetical protein
MFFVKRPVRKVLSFGLEVYQENQMITSANSLPNCSKNLIAQVDTTVLEEKRNEEPLR